MSMSMSNIFGVFGIAIIIMLFFMTDPLNLFSKNKSKDK